MEVEHLTLVESEHSSLIYAGEMLWSAADNQIEHELAVPSLDIQASAACH